MNSPPVTASRLRRLARGAAAEGTPRAPAAAPDGERCDLCAQPVADEHRHLLELGTATVCCACTACSLLFDDAGAGGNRYRLLPGRRSRLEGCVIDDLAWAGLGVPVDLAFFSRSRDAGEIRAAYPSPLGLMRSSVSPRDWARIEAAHPAVAAMDDDVEALLAHRSRADGREPGYWIVPLDDCYRLSALVRAHWKGLGGGPEVWQRIDGFFDTLATEPSFDPKEASWVSP
ncbi:DUF5947 family protein [Streptomyces sp. NPDC048389]|uniref:DUF5947 family protein n=1 Tax=Streptomyces sp. NPDC048389 TaxID=3154622 RepID=UPI003452E6F5